MSEFRSSLRKLENLSTQLGSSLSSSGNVDLMANETIFENLYVFLIKKVTEIAEKMEGMENALIDSSGPRYAAQTNRVTSSIQCKRLMREIEEAYERISQKGVEAAENEEKFKDLTIRVHKVRKTFDLLFKKNGPVMKHSDNLEVPLLAELVSQHDMPHPDDTQEASTEFKLYYEQVKKTNSVMDESLDKIMLGCSRLKESALNIHDELSFQHSMLDEINKKEDSIQGQMSFLNRRLQKILFDFNNEKVFLYLILFIMLIAVVGYIVYEAGAVRQ